MDIKLVRLTVGQDVVGEVVADNPMTITLRNPLIVAPQINEGRIEVNLAPFCIFSEEKEFAIDKGSVMFINTPVQDLKNQYNTIFGSGIVVASADATSKLGKPGHLKLV